MLKRLIIAASIKSASQHARNESADSDGTFDPHLIKVCGRVPNPVSHTDKRS